MKRLDNGLIEGINYVYDENQKINWLKMIPVECLYINQEKKNSLEKRLNKPFEEIKIEDVKDTDLVITLQGIRYLLDLRGYRYSKIKINVATPEYAAATCEICFIPNQEENFEQVYCASASAHFGNTKSWYKNYLVEASSNRALCRAVRFYLKINIVASEELGAKVDEDTQSTNNNLSSLSPVSILKNIMIENVWSFEQIKKKLIKEGIKGAEDWNKEEDLPPNVILNIIERIKNKNKKEKNE